MSDRNKAMDLYAELSESDSAKDMLEYILKNYLSGADALEALQSMKNEWYDINEEDVEDDNYDEYDDDDRFGEMI